jgi:hypothetical protein
MFQWIVFIFLLYMFLQFQIDKIKNNPTSKTDYIKFVEKYKM